MPKTITLAQLTQAGACRGKLTLFNSMFPSGEVKVTKALAKRVADKFAWLWAASHLLSRTACDEYDRVTGLTHTEYNRVKADAQAEYNRATAPAFAEYNRVRDTAQAEYNRAHATAWAKYNRVKAVTFATLYLKE
jgi:cell division septum initiation protein DivIVA